MEFKHCRQCDQDKPVTEFHRSPDTKDGLRNTCKTCANERARLWRLANRGRARESLRQWRKANPDKVRQSLRQWREANPGKVRQSQEAWHAANPDKRRQYSRATHSRLRTAVFDHYGWSCACCGSTKRLTIDHVNGDGVEHRAKVGIRTGTKTYRWLVANGFPEGFQTLCIPCNASKKSDTSCRLVHGPAAETSPGTELTDGTSGCSPGHDGQGDDSVPDLDSVLAEMIVACLAGAERRLELALEQRA